MLPPMRILYISSEYPPETSNGGIATYTRTIAHAMVKRGHTVHVVCRSLTGSEHDHRETCDDGIVVHRIGPGCHPLPQSPRWYLLRKLARLSIPNLLNRLAWARAVKQTLRRLNQAGVHFDIIEYPECGGEGFFVSATSSAPTIARLHTPWCVVRELDRIHEPLFDQIFIEYVERKSVQNARRVSSPSTACANLIAKRWRVHNIHTYPNPIDIPPDSCAGKKEWLYIGRIERRKGVDILLKAYGKLAHHPTLPLLRLIGQPFPLEGEYAQYVESLIHEPCLIGHVEWIKGVPYERLASYFEDACVAVIPSLWENFPYACLEAMAQGIAVVASRCGGLPEIVVPESTGLLFEPGDFEELARHLERFLKQPQLASSLGMNARATVSAKYASDKIASVAEEWYNYIISTNEKQTLRRSSL